MIKEIKHFLCTPVLQFAYSVCVNDHFFPLTVSMGIHKYFSQNCCLKLYIFVFQFTVYSRSLLTSEQLTGYKNKKEATDSLLFTELIYVEEVAIRFLYALKTLKTSSKL